MDTDKVTLDDLKAHRSELVERFKELGAAYATRDMPDDVREEYEALKVEREETERRIEQREELETYIKTLGQNDENREDETKFTRGRRVSSHVPDDPTRLEEYRGMASSLDDLERAYTDGALKILDTRFNPADPYADRDRTRDHVDRLLRTADLARAEDGPRSLARRIIATSSRGYASEFATYMRTQGRVVGKEMERAASLTTTAGGFAVPVELDTTLILTSAGVVNPVRALARVRTTVVNTVEFLSTTGITAAYSAEATEASDNAPTIAQPTVNIEKAQAFVPGTIEIFEDWAGIQADLAMALRDAKDTLENTKFLTGLGHASHEPQGLIAVGGATAAISTAATALAAVDLYSLETALSPRWRARAAIVGNRAAFQKVRQLDTSGGANLWVQLADGNPPTLLGYPAYEWSAYSSAVTTQGSTVLTIGDFNQFAIVDRVGMSIEFIPHLFGSSNRYPTGQRALYCYWRNSSSPLTPGLQANSAFVSLKI